MLNLFCLEFIGHVRPFKSTYHFKELVNEFIIVALTTYLFLFTDYVPDVSIRYEIGGWQWCIVLMFCMAFNLFFLMRQNFRIFWLYIVRWTNAFKATEMGKKLCTPINDGYILLKAKVLIWVNKVKELA